MLRSHVNPCSHWTYTSENTEYVTTIEIGLSTVNRFNWHWKFSFSAKSFLFCFVFIIITNCINPDRKKSKQQRKKQQSSPPNPNMTIHIHKYRKQNTQARITKSPCQLKRYNKPNPVCFRAKITLIDILLDKNLLQNWKESPDFSRRHCLSPSETGGFD